MDLNELKNLISKTGGKYIIIENDNPKYVIMDFNEFKKIVPGNNNLNSDIDVNDSFVFMIKAIQPTFFRYYHIRFRFVST